MGPAGGNNIHPIENRGVGEKNKITHLLKGGTWPALCGGNPHVNGECDYKLTGYKLGGKILTMVW